MELSSELLLFLNSPLFRLSSSLDLMFVITVIKKSIIFAFFVHMIIHLTIKSLFYNSNIRLLLKYYGIEFIEETCPLSCLLLSQLRPLLMVLHVHPSMFSSCHTSCTPTSFHSRIVPNHVHDH